MKEIDRRGRILLRLIIVSVFGTLDLLALVAILTSEPVTEPAELYSGIGIIVALNVGFLCALFCVCRSTPRVYFSDEGVYMQPFFRKKFYPWGDIRESVILKYVHRTKTGLADTNVVYHFYFLTAEGIPWSPSDTLWAYKRRNQKYFLKVPLTDESRKYAERHNIKMVIDQSEGEEILWRLVK